MSQSKKRYTIHDIKYIDETVGNGWFFSRETMKFFKDTMQDFKVIHLDSRVFIQHKKRDSVWEFYPKNGTILPISSKEFHELQGV